MDSQAGCLSRSLRLGLRLGLGLGLLSTGLRKGVAGVCGDI